MLRRDGVLRLDTAVVDDGRRVADERLLSELRLALVMKLWRGGVSFPSILTRSICPWHYHDLCPLRGVEEGCQHQRA